MVPASAATLVRRHPLLRRAIPRRSSKDADSAAEGVFYSNRVS
jgi:hypothetical protein